MLFRSTKQVKQLSNQRQMSKTLLRYTLIKKIFLTFLLKPYLYTFSLCHAEMQTVHTKLDFYVFINVI